MAKKSPLGCWYFDGVTAQLLNSMMSRPITMIFVMTRKETPGMSRIADSSICSDKIMATAIGETKIIPTNVYLSVRCRTFGPSAMKDRLARGESRKGRVERCERARCWPPRAKLWSLCAVAHRESCPIRVSQDP